MRHPAPLRSAIAATISGDALGNVTPLGLMASEPAKAVYLASHGDAEQALAALMAENFFYSVSVAIYIMLGAAAMLVTFHLPDIVRAIGIGILATMAAILAAAGWIAWQKPAIASAVLARVPVKRLERWVTRVRDFEVHTYGSTGHERARLGRLVAAETIFHVLSFTESWLTLALVTGASQPIAALVFDSLNRVINVVFKVIPMKFGVDEFSSAQMADAIGIGSNVGVVMALVRKVRLAFWAIVGFAIYANRGLGKGRANLAHAIRRSCNGRFPRGHRGALSSSPRPARTDRSQPLASFAPRAN